MITNATAQGVVPAANDIRDIKPPIEIPNGWEWLWLTLGVLAGAAVLFALWKWWQKRRDADCVRAAGSRAHPREAKTGGGAGV